MEPKVTIFSRDRKKKVCLQPAVTSLLSQDNVDQKTKMGLEHRSERTSNRQYWQSPSVQSRKKKKKRNRQEIFSMILSIIGAILVGVIMGASILSIFFTNEPTYSKNSIDSHLSLPKPKQKTPTLKPLPVYLLQAGIFQHRSGAERKMQDYQKQGLPAVISVKPPYRLYVGVSFDQAGAIQLAKLYQKQGIKVFVREQTISFQSQSKSTVLVQVLHRSRGMLQALSQFSIQGLTQRENKLDPQVEKEYQRLLQETQTFKRDLPKKEKEQLHQILQAWDQAIQSAKKAKNQANHSSIMIIQRELLRYVNLVEGL